MTLVPDELRGVWRRERITAPGHLDTTTRVFWVQSASWYGDIRVRADVPRQPGARSFEVFTDADLVALAHTQGFAGQLAVTPEMCAWRRDLDYQPPSATADEGSWRFEGPDTLIEGGIHGDYEEVWLREPQSTGPFAAFAAPEGGGLLVVAGDHFLMTEGRAEPLPAGENLPTLVQEALARGDRSAAEAWLSMPITYGRIGAGWTVALSTLPWREGDRPWDEPPVYSAADGRLTTSDGRIWSQLEAVDPDGRLADLFALATTQAATL